MIRMTMALGFIAALAACSSTVSVGDAGGGDVASEALVDVPAVCALPGGGTCPVGNTCPTGDGCNMCLCMSDGTASCTGHACVDATLVDAVTIDATHVDVSMADATRPDAPRTCTAQSQCGPSEECQGGLGCLTPWTCGPRLGRACSSALAPFCGCDGSTFMASVTCPDRPYQHEGACSAAPMACRLPSGARCPMGMTCPLGDGCNDCTCDSSGMSVCTARPCAFDAGPPRPTCYSQLDCPSGQECAGSMGCDIPWMCRAETDRFCRDDAVAYCGCDGRTFYGSSTCAPRPYATTGACGAVDAGPMAVDCAPDHTSCGGIPPTCPRGQVPRIVASCWSGCVDFASCAPITCDPTISRQQCPPGYACLGSHLCGLPTP